MSVLSYTIISVLIISSISMIGLITLSLSKRILDKLITYLVSFATGTLFGGALIHLLPQAYASNMSSLSVSLWTIAGLSTFFIMEPPP